MSLSFEQPWWLLLTLAGVPLVWAGLRWFHSMTKARKVATVALRALLVGLLSAALAGAAAVRQTDRLAVIALVDVSASVRAFADFGVRSDGRPVAPSEALRSWLERSVGDRTIEDLLGVVLFDGGATAVLAPRPGAASGAHDGSLADRSGLGDVPLDAQMGEGTNIAQAIRLARAMAPPNASSRLLLISDGVETSGDALGAAIESSGGPPARIDVLALAYGQRPEVMVEFVDAPPTAQTESTVTVRVGLRGSRVRPNEPVSGTLRLQREGEDVDLSLGEPGTGRRVTFTGERHVELLEVKLDDRAIHRFRAYFEPDSGPPGQGPPFDTLASNNAGDAFTITPGRGAVLIVDGVSDADPRGAGGTLGATLTRAGLNVETVPPGAFPPDLLALHAYDLVILQNVSADEIPQASQAMLVDYVEELGGGLLMVGGPDSFGAGGWKGSPLEPILPVRLDLPQELLVPAAAIVLVLDNSGSMGQRVLGGMRTQQQIANDAAALAIETLDEGDLIGVITFNSEHRTLAPLEPGSDPRQIARRVRNIAPGGGTNLYPALDAAGEMLRGVKAQVRHIVVLSDGRSQGSPFEGAQIAAGLAADGITVSTIAVGDAADTEALADIASEGRGAYHRVIDPDALPRIFFKEIRKVSRPLVRETPFTPTVLPTGSPLIAGAPAQWRTLGGLTLTQRRPEPTITYAAETPTREPLLAHWNVGLGQVGAFTSDAHAWAAEWTPWEGYTQIWTQIARTLARAPGGRGGELTSEITGDQLRIRLVATADDGSPRDLLSVPGMVYAPGSPEPVPVRLTQTGPGVYEAAAPARDAGSYVVVLTPRSAEAPLAPVVGGASRLIGAEFRRLRSDIALLRRIAESTGGRVLDLQSPETADLFNRDGLRPSRAVAPLWRLLAIWCVLVMLLDVASRRVAWDRLVTREVADELRRNAREALRERSDRAAATVSKLRGGSERRAERPDIVAGGSTEPAPPPTRIVARPRKARLDPAAPAPPTPAEEAARQERVRRALAAQQGRAVPGREPVEPASQAERPAEREGGSTGGLLDAKRRVRERFSPNDPSPGADDEKGRSRGPSGS